MLTKITHVVLWFVVVVVSVSAIAMLFDANTHNLLSFLILAFSAMSFSPPIQRFVRLKTGKAINLLIYLIIGAILFVTGVGVGMGNEQQMKAGQEKSALRLKQLENERLEKERLEDEKKAEKLQAKADKQAAKEKAEADEKERKQRAVKTLSGIPNLGGRSEPELLTDCQIDIQNKLSNPRSMDIIHSNLKYKKEPNHELWFQFYAKNQFNAESKHTAMCEFDDEGNLLSSKFE